MNRAARLLSAEDLKVVDFLFPLGFAAHVSIAVHYVRHGCLRRQVESSSCVVHYSAIMAVVEDHGLFFSHWLGHEGVLHLRASLVRAREHSLLRDVRFLMMPASRTFIFFDHLLFFLDELALNFFELLELMVLSDGLLDLIHFVKVYL